MVVLSVLLSLILAGFGGFIAGKKNTPEKSQEEERAVQEVRATEESSRKLDEAFDDLREGNPKKALLAFQEVASRQPALFGIDYLVGNAAYLAGETALAKEAFEKSVSKKELEPEASLLVALMNAQNDRSVAGGKTAIADPAGAVESALSRCAALRPMDPRVQCLWAEWLRSGGSYRSASEVFHRALVRADSTSDPSLIAAKEALSRMQNDPPRQSPSLSTVTSLDGPQAVAAAYAAFANQHPDDGVLFLERGSEFFPKPVFRALLRDQAFDEFRSEAKFRDFSGKF